jgi:hypothetical protein
VHATFTPEILGRATTIRVEIRISAGAGEIVPPPLIEGQLRYPAGMNVQLSGLGIDACRIAALQAQGLSACPPDSRMGYGSAVAQAPIKGEAFYETAKIAILRAPEQHGHQAIMLYVYGETGLQADLVLPSPILPAAKPFGGLLAVHVPLVPTVPEGPDVSVTKVDFVLGPKNLTYTERIHKKTVHYKPAGVPLPRRCPRGGFPFQVTLRFMDGERAEGRTAVACPRRR